MQNLLLLSLSLFLFSCTTDHAPTKEGPKGSWWLGGADGGAFIDIKDDDNKNDLIYTGTIYFDSDNSVWYSGPFKLVGALKFSPDDRTDYIYWDGERLHLKDGSYLVAINPIPNL